MPAHSGGELPSLPARALRGGFPGNRTCDGKLGFRIHALAYAGTIALLLGINLLTGGYSWAGWAIASWTVGLVAHWWFGPHAKVA